jgi:hypothetical protein
MTQSCQLLERPAALRDLRGVAHELASCTSRSPHESKPTTCHPACVVVEALHTRRAGQAGQSLLEPGYVESDLVLAAPRDDP